MTPLLAVFLVLVLTGSAAILADHFVGMFKARRQRRRDDVTDG